MRQKAFLKLEKKMACDLRPGDLFVMEEQKLPQTEPMLSVFIRSNMPTEELDDMDALVYKVHIVVTDPEDPAPPRVNPHAPPGVTQ